MLDHRTLENANKATVSLIRSFTTRRQRSEDLSSTHIGRAASQRAGKPVVRSQISSPVALVSSTNAQSFDAPDIVGTTPIGHGHRNVSSGSSADSSHSAEDSDASTLSIESHTDASSVEDNSPLTPEAEPNHLSCYFKPAVDTTTGNSSPTESTRTSLDAPAIPKRVPSHSKKAHEHLHRKRSVQRMMSPPPSVVKRDSAEMFKPIDAPRDNPFGKELAQLDEVAEEIVHTVRDVQDSADADYMQAHGLACYTANDYLSDIHSLIYDVYLAETPSWI